MPIDDNDENTGARRWVFLVCGVVLLVIAYYLHGVFTDLEKFGGSVRVNRLAAGLYKLLGKWGVVGLSGLLGAGMCWRAFVPGEPEE